MSNDWIDLPPSDDHSVPLAPRIRNDPKFFPFFKDCVGAMDGSLLPLSVPASEAAAHRCRKGFLAQNIFASCDFDLTFQYILAGWKGSAMLGPTPPAK